MAAAEIPQSLTKERSGTFPSEQLDLNVPEYQTPTSHDGSADSRPQPVKHVSAPSYQSPLRHHARVPSTPRRHVKETLNARSEYSTSGDDGTAEHRINQYLIKEEIGRGSFGAVHVAVDQFGHEYAVKEFSKSRLRKRAQSNLLRASKQRPKGHFIAGKGFNSPLHRREPGQVSSSLDLIREEIAIMKKLDHPNIVSLVEVLDDPEEDSLYMVMEMCKKGVVMKVGLDQTADPYDLEKCRLWFRDMVLGLEYLHAQGIVHRDIKPDNCLVTSDDTLKIVDFGVSQMFEKDSDMNTTKSAGSPAFMPPELCVAKHGEVSGRACDIWSMGATLYCLRYGHIPFEKSGVLDLYESIREDKLNLGDESDKDFKDLMVKLLKKDPDERIDMDDIRNHPWVTKQGSDPLLSREENVAAIVEAPTQEELNHAITGNMGRLLVVVKAARRFKQLLAQRRPELFDGVFGGNSRLVQPPLSIQPMARTKSSDLDNRRPIEYALTAEGVHREIPINDNLMRVPEQIDHEAIYRSKSPQSSEPTDQTAHEAELLRQSEPLPEQVKPLGPLQLGTLKDSNGHRGQAHDPLEDTLYLGIGDGTEAPVEPGSFAVVSESPGAVDINVYEKAYQDEIERILAKKPERRPTLYLTRRVEHIKDLRENENITGSLKKLPLAANMGLKKLVDQALANVESASPAETSQADPASSGTLAKVSDRASAAAQKSSETIANVAPISRNKEPPPRTKLDMERIIAKAKENIEAARVAAAAKQQEEGPNSRSSSRFGITRLVNKAREQFEAARPTRAPQDDAK